MFEKYLDRAARWIQYAWLTSPPKLETQWTCIAGADQTLLAAQLSSYFNEAVTYFAVLEFPAAALPSENVPQKNDVGQMLMRRAAFINNCLVQFQPDNIVLLGLPPVAQDCLREMIPPQKLITVDTEAELLALPFLTTTERDAARQEPTDSKRSAPNLPNRSRAPAVVPPPGAQRHVARLCDQAPM